VNGLRVQGTSMATPHVAGIAALIIGKAGRGKLTPAQVGAVIQATAQKLPCPKPEPYIPRVSLMRWASRCIDAVQDMMHTFCDAIAQLLWSCSPTWPDHYPRQCPVLRMSCPAPLRK